MNARVTLLQLSEQIMAPDAGYAELKEATEALFRLFCDLAALDEKATLLREHRNLDSGKAIGTLWAGMCLNEILRTRRFLLGIHKALQDLMLRFVERPLRVAYAGTGPFATLVLPLLGRWTPEQVTFELMDINDASLACLRRVVDALDANAWVSEIHCCDATRHQFADGMRPHLIVSETMLHALKNEPQVSIALNLAPQLLEGGIFVPQNVIVDVGLFHHQRWLTNIQSTESMGSCVQRIGTAFALDTRQMPVPEYREESRVWFPQTHIAVPEHREAGFDELHLFTEIQVYDEIRLRDWECSLNLPEPLLQSLPEGTFDIVMHYEVSEKPGLRWRITSDL